MEKILEIAVDNGVKHTRYFTLNPEAGEGCDSKFFEGDTINGKYVRPLKHAKIWAKEHGYTHLQVLRIGGRGRNRTYAL